MRRVAVGFSLLKMSRSGNDKASRGLGGRMDRHNVAPGFRRGLRILGLRLRRTGVVIAYVLLGLEVGRRRLEARAFTGSHASARAATLRGPRRLPGFNLGAGLSSVGRLASHAAISASSQSRVFGPTRRPGGKPLSLIQRASVTRLLKSPRSLRSRYRNWRASIGMAPV